MNLLFPLPDTAPVFVCSSESISSYDLLRPVPVLIESAGLAISSLVERVDDLSSIFCILLSSNSISPLKVLLKSSNLSSIFFSHSVLLSLSLSISLPIFSSAVESRSSSWVFRETVSGIESYNCSNIDKKVAFEGRSRTIAADEEDEEIRLPVERVMTGIDEEEEEA